MWKLLLLLTSLPAQAGTLFDSAEPLAIEIKAPFANFAKANYKEETSFPSTLVVGEQEMPIQISPRGNYRRISCYRLPPLKIELPKGKRIAPFEHMDRDLKLVTACAPNPDSDQTRDLVREYVQYKLLLAAEFPTFLIRRLNVVYRNPDGSEFGRGPAFVIENIKDFTKRTRATSAAKPPAFGSAVAELVLVELLLRNSDFVISPKGKDFYHNLRPVIGPKKKLVGFVPYDFDLTALTRGESIPSAERIQQDMQNLVSGADYRSETKLSATDTMPYMRKLIDHRAALLAEVENSPLSDEDKKFFAEWITKFLDVIGELTKQP